jgi:hypothetical protein
MHLLIASDSKDESLWSIIPNYSRNREECSDRLEPELNLKNSKFDRKLRNNSRSKHQIIRKCLRNYLERKIFQQSWYRLDNYTEK